MGVAAQGSGFGFVIIAKAVNVYSPLLSCDGFPRGINEIPADAPESQLKAPGVKVFLQRDWRQRRTEFATTCDVLAEIASNVIANPVAKVQRGDNPTDAEITFGRSVLETMPAKNPSVRAFRNAARAAGLKGANAKLGKIYQQLNAEQK